MSKQKFDEYLAERRKLGLAPQMFAFVAGKTIESMQYAFDDDGQPHVNLRLMGGETLDMTWEAKPKIVAEWSRPINNGMETETIPKRTIFE